MLAKERFGSVMNEMMVLELDLFRDYARMLTSSKLLMQAHNIPCLKFETDSCTRILEMKDTLDCAAILYMSHARQRLYLRVK